MKIRVEARLPRNPGALPAKMRHAGPMKHANASKGGAVNWRDLLEDDDIYRPKKYKSRPVKNDNPFKFDYDEPVEPGDGFED